MRIAVIGLGQIAENAYLPELHNPRAGFEVRWLCDSNPQRLEWAASVVSSAKRTDHFVDILRDKEVDWVFVLTPLLTHAGLARKALEAGKNVFTEKPLSMDFAEAENIIAYARRRRLMVASAPVMLLYPSYQYARKLILGGALGRPSSARVIMASGGPNTWEFKTDPGWFFRSKTASAIPPIPDLAVYGFSYLAHVFGPAERVSAMSSRVVDKRRIDKVTEPGFRPYAIRPDVDDNVVVNLGFANGVVASVTSNYTSGGKRPMEYEFYGTEGTLTMSLAGDAMRMHSNTKPLDKSNGFADVNLKGKTGGRFYREWMWGPIIARHLVRAAEIGAEPLIGRDFTLHVSEIIDRAMEAAEQGTVETLTTGFRQDPKWKS